MTGSRRRILIDRRRRRADARPIRRQLAALDSGKELAEAVLGSRPSVAPRPDVSPLPSRQIER